MDHVGHDIVEQALIVRDHNGRFVRAVKCVDAVGNNAQGVDIESRIGFVEYGERGSKTAICRISWRFFRRRKSLR